MKAVAEYQVQTPTKLEVRASIQALEDHMKTAPIEWQSTGEEFITHYFAPGVCARQMFLPAGSTWVGKIHKTRHVSIISCGKAILSTENGDAPILIEGPYTFVNVPGEKRALYILEDMIWTAIHVTDETDIAKIEDEVIAVSFDELEGPSFTLLEGDK